MNENKPNLKQQLENLTQWREQPHLGEKDCYYFYDWFCKDRALERRSGILFSRLKTFLKHVDIDLEKTYVFFKNNCPLGGPLYDDFRICDLETGNVLYTVTPDVNGTSEIWGAKNNFEEPLVSSEGWGPRRYFAVIKELSKQLTAEVADA